MSNNPVLTYLNCSDQHGVLSGVLSSLDLRNTLIGNGGNGNPYNLYLDAKNNLGLFCIDVSDASWATYFWGGTVAVDSWVSFSLDCDLIWGCTDTTSPNYDSLATADDGSCIYYGCTDTTACNYDQSANTNDGECSYVFCVGCTDPVACNYDSTATIDDGSCNYIPITIPSLNITACDSLIFYEATYDSSGIYSVVIPGDTSLFNNLQFPEIDGEPGWNYSGSSVSISSNGLIVAVGAEIGDYVKVYSWDTLNFHWDQLGSMIQVDPESISLSSDGYTVAIGGSDYPTSISGIVRIYQFVNGDWYQKGQDLNGDANYDHFGFSISLSNDGNTVAVGASGKDDNGSNSGQVRIYTYNGTSWNQLGQDIDGESAGDYSGGSVSLSSDGSTVAIGAISNDGNGSSSGHVRVYQNNGGVWNQIGQDIDGEASQDRSGESVSLSSGGNIVAIGAKFNDGNGSDAGHVRLYEYEDSVWVKVGQDIDGEAADDLSGKSVALSSDGKTVVIGAPNNDGNGSLSGHIRVYNTIFDVDCDSVINLDLIIVNNATGCTDSIACNYDSTAFCDDGSCVYPGCTDSLSINYDPAAGCDDGSCCYDAWVTLNMYDSYGDGWNGDYFTMTNVASSTVVFNVTLDNGSIGYENGCVPNGCYDIVVDSGSWQSEVSWTLVYGTGNIIASGGSPYLGQVCVYFGCTDSTALNYNPLANNDDGTCTYCVYGCMDPLYLEYSAAATCDDGSCLTLISTNTCTNPSPTNAYITELIHDRARVNWDNMNDANCMVQQYRIRYREQGTS
ncbi:MAG: hypothetical protein HN522_06730, partial [Flavobacteriales bacterium]|nr:hypothetical protein [Flavobacteriales bacterium]